MIKKIIIIIALVLIAGFGFRMWYGGNGAPSGMAGGAAPGGFAMPVDAVRITPQPLTNEISTVGTLRSDESVVLRPEIAGRVEKIHFEEGTPAKKGEILITLDDSLAQAELQQAMAQLKLQQTEQNRARKLKQSGAVSQSRLDQANADLSVAEANASLARARLEKTRIYAPFNGVVGLRNVSPGEYVNAGQELASFEGFHPMKVDLRIPEVYAPDIKPGQTIELRVDAFPGETFTGTVYALDPQIEAGGRSVALRATIPNPEGKLKPGYFARVDLKMGARQDALLAPESAIVPKGSEAYIFVIGEENKVHLTPVQTGIRREGKVEIRSGLQPGDMIVVAGQMKIQEGMAVTPKVAGEKKAMMDNKIIDDKKQE